MNSTRESAKSKQRMNKVDRENSDLMGRKKTEGEFCNHKEKTMGDEKIKKRDKKGKEK